MAPVMLGNRDEAGMASSLGAWEMRVLGNGSLRRPLQGNNPPANRRPVGPDCAGQPRVGARARATLARTAARGSLVRQTPVSIVRDDLAVVPLGQQAEDDRVDRVLQRTHAAVTEDELANARVVAAELPAGVARQDRQREARPGG